jgi:hypothetical protein
MNVANGTGNNEQMHVEILSADVQSGIANLSNTISVRCTQDKHTPGSRICVCVCRERGFEWHAPSTV